MTYPNTIATDVIRRLGMSDVYSLTPGGVITCSVDKRGGLYSGSVIYTTDVLITKNSGWIAVSVSDTVDVVDVAIPSDATGVAFICAAITDPATPRVGAAFSVKDAQTAHSRSRHLRFRYASGDGAQVAFTPLLLPPDGFINWIDFTDQGTLYSDTGRTSLISGAQDESILGVTDKGSRAFHLASSFGGAIGPIFRPNMAGSGFSGAKFDRIDASNGAGLRSADQGFSDKSFGLLIGVLEDTPAATASLFIGPHDPETLFEVLTTATQVHSRAFDAKGVQVWNHSLNTLFACWAENTGTQPRASVNRVVGDGTKVNGISAATGDRLLCGTGANLGGSSFADGSIFEAVLWDDSGAAVPTIAQAEAYVTTKYALTWL